MTNPQIKFGNQVIGGDARTYIIAEAGSNHNGDLDIALELINTAADAGADAVKFQTFRADETYVEDSGGAEYLDDDRSLYDIIAAMEMPYEWIPTLQEHAASRDIQFMSTPSDPRSVDELDPFVPAFKIESFHMSNHPFLRYVAQKGKPIILSTGAHELDEIAETIDVLQNEGVEDLVILHCVSGYPTPLDQINVRVVKTLRDRFGIDTGLSDHTLDPTTAPVAAVSLGGSVVEKHFTLDKSMPGPDHAFALDPDELSEMVTAIRKTERALGDGVKRLAEAEKELHDKARRFVHARTDISAGEAFTEDNIGILCHGELDPGLLPKHYDEVLGSTATRDIEQSAGITWDDIR